MILAHLTSRILVSIAICVVLWTTPFLWEMVYGVVNTGTSWIVQQLPVGVMVFVSPALWLVNRAIIAVSIFVFAWTIVHFVIVAVQHFFGLARSTWVSEGSRFFAQLFAVLSSFAMTAWALSILHSVDVQIYGPIVFARYETGRTITFYDGVNLGFWSLVYVIFQMLHLCFRPSMNRVWKWLDVSSSLMFVVLVAWAWVLFVFDSPDMVRSIYRRQAMYIWSLVALIDVLHMIVAAWQRNVYEADQFARAARENISQQSPQ